MIQIQVSANHFYPKTYPANKSNQATTKLIHVAPCTKHTPYTFTQVQRLKAPFDPAL